MEDTLELAHVTPDYVVCAIKPHTTLDVALGNPWAMADRYVTVPRGTLGGLGGHALAVTRSDGTQWEIAYDRVRDEVERVAMREGLAIENHSLEQFVLANAWQQGHGHGKASWKVQLMTADGAWTEPRGYDGDSLADVLGKACQAYGVTYDPGSVVWKTESTCLAQVRDDREPIAERLAKRGRVEANYHSDDEWER